jgi:hypothetical protein
VEESDHKGVEILHIFRCCSSRTSTFIGIRVTSCQEAVGSPHGHGVLALSFSVWLIRDFDH